MHTQPRYASAGVCTDRWRQARKLLKIFYVFEDMKADVININPEIIGGTPVFKGTRVPIETLFDHLESGITIDAFLDDYPTVTKEQVIQVL